MIGEYGGYQWNKGFVIGYFSGLCVGGILVWIISNKR